jgi:hypothetical protein
LTLDVLGDATAERVHTLLGSTSVLVMQDLMLTHGGTVVTKDTPSLLVLGQSNVPSSDFCPGFWVHAVSLETSSDFCELVRLVLFSKPRLGPLGSAVQLSRSPLWEMLNWTAPYF